MIQKFNQYKKLYEKKSNFNSLIDYTYLKTNATTDNIKQLCKEAEDNKYYSVCIQPDMINTAKAFLDDTDVKICTVISFPNGNDKTTHKLRDTTEAITSGADEIDMVIDFNKIKKLSIETNEEYKDIYNDVLEDVKTIARTCHKDGVILKTIIEIDELNYNQIKLACQICTDAGADFIQTSTGLSKTVKSFEDKVEKLSYIRKILPDFIKIKMSGGIRTQDQINSILPFVDRIGTSIVIE